MYKRQRAPSLLDEAEAPTPATSSKVSTLVLAITLRGSFAPYPDGCLAGDVELPSLEELASGLVVAPWVALGGGGVATPGVMPVVVVPVVAVDNAVAVEDAAAAEERRREAARAAALAEATQLLEVAEGAARLSRDALVSAEGEREVARGALESARDALRAAEARETACDAAVGEAERGVAARERDVEAARAAVLRAGG